MAWLPVWDEVWSENRQEPVNLHVGVCQARCSGLLLACCVVHLWPQSQVQIRVQNIEAGALSHHPHSHRLKNRSGKTYPQQVWEPCVRCLWWLNREMRVQALCTCYPASLLQSFYPECQGDARFEFYWAAKWSTRRSWHQQGMVSSQPWRCNTSWKDKTSNLPSTSERAGLVKDTSRNHVSNHKSAW